MTLFKTSRNCKTLEPQEGFRKKPKTERKRDEWCRSTRFLLQRGSTPWLCGSLSLQGTTFMFLFYILNLLYLLNILILTHPSLSTAFADAEAIQIDKTRFLSSRPRLRPWCLASGLSFQKLKFLWWVFMGVFVFMDFMVFCLFILLLQVACQSLGPLKTGGVVVGIDLKVLFLFIQYSLVL